MRRTSCELPSRFAIYCGSGVYVQSVKLDTATKLPVIDTGSVHGALCASRRVAVGALHAARRAGLRAWLVQHPARAIGATVVAAAA